MVSVEVTAITNVKSDHIDMRWPLKDWKLTRQYHTCRTKQLTSPIYETNMCKWQLELLVNSVNSSPESSKDHLKASIYLLDCRAKPSAVVVRGFIGIRVLDTENWYNKTNIFGMMIITERKSNKSSDIENAAGSIEVVAELDISFGDPDVQIQRDAVKGKTNNEDIRGQLKSLSNSLSTLVNDYSTSDLTIHVDGKLFYGHKALLSMRSSVFKEMFEEKSSSRRAVQDITIEGINAETWMAFQTFLYTGQTLLDKDKLFNFSNDLLMLASRYEVDHLTHHIANNLRAIINKNNVLEILDLSNRHALSDLQEKALTLFGNFLDYYKRERKAEFVKIVQRNQAVTELLLDRLLSD